MSMDLS